jgi:nicotinate-nucleotide adenylyltransferase
VRDSAARRIGILGGTFDPVHNGHLRTALEVAERLALDELRLVPASVPPHRGAPLATAAERLRMLQLAADAHPGFVVDDRELVRGGASYTIDTLRSLRAELGGAARLCLIVGLDAFAAIDTWKEWRALGDHAHIVVVQRPGAALALGEEAARWAAARFAADAGQALTDAAHGAILRLELTQLAISATHIRELLVEGRSPRYLLPDAVLDYIRENRIYTRAAAQTGDTD